jgi:dolichyldiphosphatase
MLQSFVVCCGAATVCTSRVYLRYHTQRQVLTGAGVGVVLGISWYITVMILRWTGWVDWVLRLKVVEMLWIKDGDIGSLEHDLHEEWFKWRQRRDKELARQKKGKTS